MKKLLSIGVSDCIAGSGIQADLKTFSVYKDYGMTVVTALTSQNTMGVTEVVNLSPDFVGKQMDAVFEDIYPDAVKIGMVPDEGIIKMVARKLRQYEAENIVIDPYMFLLDGSDLMDSKALKAYKEELLPMADIVTPTIKEAASLAEIEDTNSRYDTERTAMGLANMISGVILIRGGHLLETADDLLCIDKELKWMERERLENPNTQGAGDTLSSAITANLARGRDIETSYKEATEYLVGVIKNGLNLGRGRGPLNQVYNIKPMQ